METLGVLDTILKLLEDGQPHTLNEISTLEPCRRIPITTLMEVLNFLEEFDFTENDYNSEMFVSELQMTPLVRAFWKTLNELSEKR